MSWMDCSFEGYTPSRSVVSLTNIIHSRILIMSASSSFYSPNRLRHMPKIVRQTQKKCILIVEDSIDFSNLLKFIVEDEGFEGLQFPVDQPDIVTPAKEHKP